MATAASNVLVLRKDLLDAVMDAAVREQNNAVSGGIVSLGSVCVAVSEGLGAASAAGGAAATGAGAAAGTAAGTAAATGVAATGAAASGATAATGASAAVGTAAATSAGAVLLPIVAGGVAVYCAVWAWDSYNKSKELKKEYTQFKASMLGHFYPRFCFTSLLTQ